MADCSEHLEYFEEGCEACRQEYFQMMTQRGAGPAPATHKEYKDLDEERAKSLYERIFLQYLKSGRTEVDAANLARIVIKKQCELRNIEPWPWV